MTHSHHEHDDDHDHDHGGHAGDHGHHHHAPKDFGRAFALGTALNVALVAAQIGYGLAANSMALLADAVHNAGDVLSLLLAWGATVLGRRAPTGRRTYGWGRSSIMAALVNAAVLLVSVGAIAWEAARRFHDPSPVAEMTVIVVASLGIVINGFTAWLFARGQDDLNIRGAFLHMVGDAAVSAGVVVAAILIGVTGWQWLDPAASILICVAIGVSSWGLLRDSVNLAMDAVPASIDRDAVQTYLAALPGVQEVHDLHIWALSTSEVALTAHLVRADAADDQGLLRDACAGLQSRFAIGHATLQVETAANADLCRLRPAHVV